MIGWKDISLDGALSIVNHIAAPMDVLFYNHPRQQGNSSLFWLTSWSMWQINNGGTVQLWQLDADQQKLTLLSNDIFPAYHTQMCYWCFYLNFVSPTGDFLIGSLSLPYVNESLVKLNTDKNFTVMNYSQVPSVPYVAPGYFSVQVRQVQDQNNLFNTNVSVQTVDFTNW